MNFSTQASFLVGYNNYQVFFTCTDPDSSLLPATDSYNFNNPDGSRSIIQFENQGSGDYRIQQNTTESDGVLTSVDQDSMSTQTRIQTSGVASNINIQPIGDDDFALLVDGNSILNFNIDRFVESNVGNGQTVTYQNNTLSILNGDTVNNISMFTYYDGFRFYQFNDTKINPLSGNGTLFYSPNSGMAVYSIDPQFTSFFSTIVSSLRNESSTEMSPSVPVVTTGIVFPTVPTITFIIPLSSAPVPTVTPAPTTPQPPGTTADPVTADPATTIPLPPATTGQQQPATTGPQQPATTGPQQPATTGPQQPATTGPQQPATTGPQQPATTGPQQPATTGPQQPATTGPQQPATTGPQQPATTGPQQPATTGPQQPATTGPQQPATTAPQQPATTPEQGVRSTAEPTDHPSMPSSTDEPDGCETRSKSSDRSKTSKTHRHSKSHRHMKSHRHHHHHSKYRTHSHKDKTKECSPKVRPQPVTTAEQAPSTAEPTDRCKVMSKSSRSHGHSKTRHSKHRSRSRRDVSDECSEETGTEVDTSPHLPSLPSVVITSAPNERSRSRSRGSRGRKSRRRKSRGKKGKRKSKHPSSKSRTSKKSKKSRKPKKKGRRYYW